MDPPKRKFGRDMGYLKIKIVSGFSCEKTGYRIEVKTSSCKLGMPPKIFFLKRNWKAELVPVSYDSFK